MSNVFHYYIFCSKNTSITTKSLIEFWGQAELSEVVDDVFSVVTSESSKSKKYVSWMYSKKNT